MKRFTAAALLVVFAAACASNSASKVASVSMRTHSLPFFGSGTSAPVNLDITVTNISNAPLTVRSIRVTSLNMLEYEVASVEKLFNETIAPGESKTVPYTTTAIRTASNDSADEDLSLRAEIDFEAAGGKRTREVFTFPRVGT